MAEEKTPAPVQELTVPKKEEGLNLDVFLVSLPTVTLGGKEYAIRTLEPESMVNAMRISSLAKKLTADSKNAESVGPDEMGKTIKDLSDQYSAIVKVGVPGLLEEHPEMTFAMKQAVVRHLMVNSRPKEVTTTEKSSNTTSSGSSPDSAKSSQPTK